MEIDLHDIPKTLANKIRIEDDYEESRRDNFDEDYKKFLYLTWTTIIPNYSHIQLAQVPFTCVSSLI